MLTHDTTSRPCTVASCLLPHKARGYCDTHYRRWLHHGSPEKMVAAPLPDRFWERVNKTESCWLWTGGHTSAGYGLVRARRGDKTYAHRLSWEMANGPIPDGLYVCHRCDTPACVRPDHLFLGSVVDNNRDLYTKGRGRTGLAHPWTRLSDDDVRAIRQEHAAGGRTFTALASTYGVAPKQISRIVKGLRRKGVA